MLYVLFVTKEGGEKLVHCDSIDIRPRDGWDFVTLTVKTGSPHLHEDNYCVGVDWESMFVMNEDGRTIKKIVRDQTSGHSLLRSIVASAEVQDAPDTMIFHTPHKIMTIAVGSDEHATLTMSEEAFNLIS